MALSVAQKEAYARAHVDVNHKYCIELRHSTFPSGFIRVVDHDVDIWLTLEATAPIDASTLVQFTGIAGEVADSGSSAGPDNPVSILLDGVSGYLQPYLYNAAQYFDGSSANEVVDITIRPVGVNVDDDSTYGVNAVLHLELLGAMMDLENIQLSSGYSNSANVAFPGVYFTPDSNPSLY